MLARSALRGSAVFSRSLAHSRSALPRSAGLAVRRELVAEQARLPSFLLATSRRLMSTGPAKGPAAAPRAAAPGVGQSPIVEGTAANFQTNVLQSPMPVIVDCYADWCQPCKILTPLLERAVLASKGRVRLVKINVDRERELGAALRVQSIPAVFGVHKGRVVDSFQGALPEADVNKFVEAMSQVGGAAAPAEGEGGDEATTPEELMKEGYALLSKANPSGASASFARARQQLVKQLTSQREAQQEARAQGRPTPKATQAAIDELGIATARATAGLARAALAAGDLEAAQRVVAVIREELGDYQGNADVSQAISAVELAVQAAGAAGEDVQQLEAAVAANAADLGARMTLARAYLARSLFDRALEQALAVLRRDAKFEDGAARAFLIKLFDMLGPEHELTRKGRARMANYMFK